MKRNEHQISKSINLLIHKYLLDLENLKDVFRIYTMNQHLLRKKLKMSALSGYEKKKVEHRIHRNKIILRGLSEYIVDLRSEMKDVQRRHPMNMEKIRKENE